MQHQLSEQDQPFYFAGNILPDVLETEVDTSVLPPAIDLTTIGGIRIKEESANGPPQVDLSQVSLLNPH